MPDVRWWQWKPVKRKRFKRKETKKVTSCVQKSISLQVMHVPFVRRNTFRIKYIN